jgi:hypothetical protein
MNNNRDEIVNKLFAKQIDNVDPKYRLNAKDIIRLSSYIGSDPFSETECCKWKGAISKSSHQSKYINFWFNKKKQALHRILYLNYKGELSKNKYLRFNCSNASMRGVCCNINHLDIINTGDNDNNNNDNNNDNDNDNDNDNIQQKNIENEVQQTINDNLNQQIGTTGKAKKSSKNTSKIADKTTTIQTANNTYKNDIFVIVFED